MQRIDFATLEFWKTSEIELDTDRKSFLLNLSCGIEKIEIVVATQRLILKP